MKSAVSSLPCVRSSSSAVAKAERAPPQWPKMPVGRSTSGARAAAAAAARFWYVTGCGSRRRFSRAGSCTRHTSTSPIRSGQARYIDAPVPEYGKRNIRAGASSDGWRNSHLPASVCMAP